MRSVVQCAVLLGCLLSACGSSTSKVASWPEGTVLAVDGTAILSTDVDAHAKSLLDIKPAFSIEQRRRLIVINFALPRAYGQAHAGEARDAARAEAEDWLRSKAALPALPPSMEDADFAAWKTGNWDTLGIDLWLAARGLQDGESSGVVELPGRFAVIEMMRRDRKTNLALEQFTLRVETFNYVDNPAALIESCLQGTLEIVDPTWREAVPGFYKYTMKGEQE